jgi:methylglutaconyl-CoA hydratase
MQVDIQGGYVKTETRKEIGIIEFYHPQSNSLPSGILEELAKAFQREGHDPNIKAIVLRSGGDRVFCAGAYFEELTAIKTEAEGKKFFMGFANVINAMRKCPKFIIGLVQGKCIGGGVGLAASVDYCIAVEASEVRLSELAIGIGPFVVGPAVERKVGTAAFSHLSIDAQSWRNSDWARRKGLFAEVHATLEEAEESVRKLAFSLSHSSPDAMAEMKKVFWKNAEHWDQLLAERAAISGRLVLSEFTKNAIEQFKAKAR